MRPRLTPVTKRNQIGKSPRDRQSPQSEATPTPVDESAPVEVTQSRSLPVVEAPQQVTAAKAEVGAQSITHSELDQLRQAGEPVLILDVRTDRSLETSELQAQGAIRLPPDHVVAEAKALRLPKEAWLIAYCA